MQLYLSFEFSVNHIYYFLKAMHFSISYLNKIPIFSLNTSTELSLGSVGWLVGWLSVTSHRQRGHLETAPPFTVPCEGREAR